MKYKEINVARFWNRINKLPENVAGNEGGGLHKFHFGNYTKKNLIYLWNFSKVIFWLPLKPYISIDQRDFLNNANSHKNDIYIEHAFDEQVSRIHVGKLPLELRGSLPQLDNNVDNGLMVIVCFQNSMQLYILTIQENSIELKKIDGY